MCVSDNVQYIMFKKKNSICGSYFIRYKVELNSGVQEMVR